MEPGVVSSPRGGRRPTALANPSPWPPRKRLAVATRVRIRHSAPPPLEPLKAFLSTFWELLKLRCYREGEPANCDDAVFLAVSAEGPAGDDLVEQVEAVAAMLPQGPGDPMVRVLSMAPWGQFLPALTHIVSRVALEGFDYLLFASVDATTLSSDDLGVMEQVLELGPHGQLVAGVALPGHDFRGGGREDEASEAQEVVPVPMTGCTTPWNDLALWNVQQLARFGFPLVAEGAVVGKTGGFIDGGVEEASAIAVASAHLKQGTGAWLLRLGGSAVEATGIEDDLERQAWHAMKMKSKDRRVELQMDALNMALDDFRIKHFDCSRPGWQGRLAEYGEDEEEEEAALVEEEFGEPAPIVSVEREPVESPAFVPPIDELQLIITVHVAAFAMLCALKWAKQWQKAA